ncbi:acVLRF1 family peptidyl-tRNA hydrolase [Thermoactinospora rubra]|uniref:acVLRF1 family peptidyl-tRNA hydrolase n=1 Tax=Thermoactinospora rubra TaxID=1088767 RepID=UPI000A103EC4|nr:acVLRF1 family peptidyl-tRNA hydrolase [Thermoactinospora rubra]
MARPAKGGGRWVEVPPERLHRWIDGFAGRHGPVQASAGPLVVRLVAEDGAVAEFTVPFPPLEPAAPYVARLVAHARRDRTVGVALVRLGGFAAGVFRGEELVASKVGSRHVQGRTAAGGWSQQRFARRRAGQADKALEAAADAVAGVLLPRLGELEAVVLGGDRRAVDRLRADPRLAPVLAKECPPFLDVPDPRLAVLRDTPRLFRAVRVRVVDPP